MTPAERARLIDQQEFAAESKAALRRALEHGQQARLREQKQIAVWLGREIEPVAFQKPHFGVGRKAKLHTVQGVSLPMQQWADHLGIGRAALANRIRKLGSLEAAVAFRPIGRWAGVSADFAPSIGTGAGSTAQETSKITFSGNDDDHS